MPTISSATQTSGNMEKDTGDPQPGGGGDTQMEYS
jgi:hypothetical protein